MKIFTIQFLHYLYLLKKNIFSHTNNLCGNNIYIMEGLFERNIGHTKLEAVDFCKMIRTN